MKNEITTSNIENMIYEIRGKKVMLDSDLARLYECKNGTKTINLAVKRHPNRFPERFMFQLTKEEYNNLRFQFETTNISSMSRSLPYVFTEQGVAMLSTVIHTTIAEEISIKIMDAFVKMRHYLANNLIQQQYINDMVIKHDTKISFLEDIFNKLQENHLNNEIYFKGQIFDAYSKIKEIFKSAKKELIIIDSYADITLLEIIKDIKVPVILITKEKSLLSKLDIEKYNSQYNNLEIIHSNDYHDRFFIIDNKIFYHCGTSINHAGNKTFAINLLTEEKIINLLKQDIKEIINKNKENTYIKS